MSNKGDFFVILNGQNGNYQPLLDAGGDLAKFEYEQDAKEAGKNSSLGSVYGFEVFERGYGC